MLVVIFESDDAKEDYRVIKEIGGDFIKDIDGFINDLRHNYNDMRDYKYNQKRYDSHPLSDHRLGFAYPGYIGTASFGVNHNKQLRIIWKVIYDKEAKRDYVDELSEDLLAEWNIRKAEDNYPKLVYIVRYCVEYHHGRDSRPEEIVELIKSNDSYNDGITPNSTKISDCRYPYLTRILDYRNEHPELFE